MKKIVIAALAAATLSACAGQSEPVSISPYPTPSGTSQEFLDEYLGELIGPGPDYQPEETLEDLFKPPVKNKLIGPAAEGPQIPVDPNAPLIGPGAQAPRG